jgi:two-component system sensor histidine kinase/response regulator
MVAAITHELRTPLQAIIGFGQLAQMDWPAGVDRRYLLQIEQASRLMLRVVNDLLDLSHLENGRLDIDPDQPLNLFALCSSVLSTADSLRQDKPVRLYAQVSPDCPTMLRGDGKRIEQILLNLMANAIRFTDRGEVVLKVRVRRQGPQSVTLRLAVADTGVGLSPAELALMTEPMDQGGTGPARRRGGSGFGLNIVRRLLELHGSALRATSVQGGGTLVWFDLQLMRDATPAAAARARPLTVLCTDDRRLFETVRTQWAALGLALQRASAPHEARGDGLWLVDAMRRDLGHWGEVARQAGVRLLAVSALPVAGERSVASLPQLPMMALDDDDSGDSGRGLPLQGMRVLLVEDTLLNQRVLSALMGRMGASCEVAGTAALARDMLLQGPWDAALLDVHLPDQGGLTLARWLRDQPACAELPFAILSAHVTEDERLAAHMLGAHDCLLKPIEPVHLCRVLASMRGKSTPAWRAMHGAPEPADAAVQALAGLDIQALFRQEWAALKGRLLQASSHEARRSAIHAIRGNLALMGAGAVWREARQLEDALLAGRQPDDAAWQQFAADVDAFAGVSPPHPG